MNRIKRTSIDIKNFIEISISPASPAASSPTTKTPTSGTQKRDIADTQLSTFQKLEHLITFIKEIIKFLSTTPLICETQRYHEPFTNCLALHRDLRARYPNRPLVHAQSLVNEAVLRLVQYCDLIPLTFYKERSGEQVHALQSLESRKKVLAYAKVLKDRSESVLEMAGLPIP